MTGRAAHLQARAWHGEPARCDERPTDGDVAVDGQQDGDPDSAALHGAADRVHVLHQVRSARQLHVRTTHL